MDLPGFKSPFLKKSKWLKTQMEPYASQCGATPARCVQTVKASLFEKPTLVKVAIAAE